MMRPSLSVPVLGLLVGLLAAPVLALPPVNGFQQRLAALDEPRQAAALRSAIVDLGQRCGRISAPTYRGPYKNMHLWAARCTPGGDYALFLGPDGSMQTRQCDEMAKLGLPTCNLPPVAASAAAPARRPRP